MDTNNLRNYLTVAFVKALEAEFRGYEEALSVAEAIKNVFKTYGDQTQAAAQNLLKKDYQAFHDFHEGGSRGRKYTQSLPFFSFNIWETLGPRCWVQEVQYIKLRIDNRWSGADDILMTNKINYANREFLRIEYDFSEQAIFLHAFKISKGVEAKTLLLGEKFPANARRMKALVGAFEEEILDWMMEHTPKGFSEQVMPEVERMKAPQLPAAPGSNLG